MRSSSIKLRSKEIIIYGLVAIITILASLFATAEPMLVITLLIWFGCLVHAMFHLKENIALLFFLISLFVFLLGREVCYTYFGLERYYLYLEKYNNLAFGLISLSLICIMIGSHFVANKISFEEKSTLSSEAYEKSRVICQQICRIAFIFCYICSICVVLLQIMMVKKSGYLNTYLETSQETVPAAIRYLAAFMGTSACLFLATKPNDKQYKIVLLLYEIYAILTLFTGHRYTFISISIFVLMYIYIRNQIDNKKIPRKYIIIIVVLLPLLFIGMNYINDVRVNESYSFNSMGRSIVEFFDQQGGSINVIKRVGYYADDLKDMYLVSFSNLRTVLFENAIVRKLSGITALSGNSIEHALHGFSLAHRLSYYEYGDYYLAGHGVGSCYIAELYHDFWIIGVVIGSLFYGVLLRKISNISFDNYFKEGILLASFNYLILAPRDSFDNIIGGVFNVYSLIALFIIWAVINQMTPKIPNFYS